jgi:hypothetical protein
MFEGRVLLAQKYPNTAWQIILLYTVNHAVDLERNRAGNGRNASPLLPALNRMPERYVLARTSRLLRESRRYVVSRVKRDTKKPVNED